MLHCTIDSSNSLIPCVIFNVQGESGFKDFELDSILFAGVPMISEPEFAESIFPTSGMRSPASDFLESAPPSPSPLSSPTSSSSPSSESGIEDDSDMDDQVTTPAEYAMEDNKPVNVGTKTMCLPSVPAVCTLTANEAADQARKLNEEHPNSVMEAQQELKKLLKQLVSPSEVQQPPKPPVVESTQPTLVPVFSLSTTTPVPTISGSPEEVMTNVPVTVPNGEGVNLTEAQSSNDPVSTLVSVLKQNRPAGEQHGNVIFQKNGKECAAMVEPKLVVLEEPEEVCLSTHMQKQVLSKENITFFQEGNFFKSFGTKIVVVKVKHFRQFV